MKKVTQPFISALIPAFNEADNLKKLIPLLSIQLCKISEKYEILVVDDGSSDNTFESVLELIKDYPLRIIQLSRNFGKENAITAGLKHIKADLVVLLDADFQHPLHLIPEFFAFWEQGYDMVYAISTGRNHNFFRRICGKWFYNLLYSSSCVKIEPNAGDFRLIDRKVIDSICSLSERNRFMKGIYSWVGYNNIGIPVDMAQRSTGVSKFNLRKLISLALIGITSFSALPLRIWGIIGAFISLSSITYGIYVALKTLIYGIETPGWATLVVSITLLSGIQLLSIGVLGEYIARIFTEVKGRPSYLIKNIHSYDKPDS